MEFEGVSVILGGGRSGVQWAEQINPRIIVIDKEPSLRSYTVNIALADALSIPFPNSSVWLMRADFLLNDVYLPGLKASDIIKNPRILMDPRTPLIIRQWYENLGRPRNLGTDLKQVRWLTRQVALEEMLRVLMPGGQLVIMDHRHIIRWVAQAVTSRRDIIPCTSTVRRDDFIRSASLRKLEGEIPSPPIEKIHLIKY